MLEHQKLVLKNVSNNQELFRKEIQKSLAWLNSIEIGLLYFWLKENYWDIHKNIIQDAFNVAMSIY